MIGPIRPLIRPIRPPIKPITPPFSPIRSPIRLPIRQIRPPIKPIRPRKKDKRTKGQKDKRTKRKQFSKIYLKCCVASYGCVLSFLSIVCQDGKITVRKSTFYLPG